MLRAWYAQGYSVRHIITEALLRLEEGQQEDQETAVALDEVNRALHQIIQLLEGMQNGRHAPFANRGDEEPKGRVDRCLRRFRQEGGQTWLEARLIEQVAWRRGWALR